MHHIFFVYFTLRISILYASYGMLPQVFLRTPAPRPHVPPTPAPVTSTRRKMEGQDGIQRLIKAEEEAQNIISRARQGTYVFTSSHRGFRPLLP